MAVPLDQYDKIFSRPGRPRTGDDGLVLTRDDEAALDRAWATLAEESGVEQLADQPSREQIKAFKT
jgi:hypothetical protein